MAEMSQIVEQLAQSAGSRNQLSHMAAMSTGLVTDLIQGHHATFETACKLARAAMRLEGREAALRIFVLAGYPIPYEYLPIPPEEDPYQYVVRVLSEAHR